MKNKLLFLVLLIVNCKAYSQVGIGTPMPNSSSQLEVTASNKGVLIPRISLTSSTDAVTIVSGNVNSLLVFNTAAISDIKPGYYYWYDNKWNRIVVSNEITAAPGTVIYNPTTQQFTYVDATGTTQILDFIQIVKSSETLTTLVNNGGGSYTYNNEAGTAVSIDVVGDVTSNFSTIVNNPAVTNIIQQISNTTEGNVTFNSTTNEFSYIDASGNPQIININQIVKAAETITTLDKNASNNGQYTYTSENATTTTIDVVGDVINNASTVLNNPAFVTELTNIIKSNETLTSLVYDGVANTLTYTDEKAVSTTVNLLDLVGSAETQTTLVYDPTAKTLTYNGESGTPTIINLLDLVGDAETITTISPIVTTGNTIATYTNESGGTPTEIKETATILTQNVTTGAITYNNETGIGTIAQVRSADSGNILTIGTDGGALLTPSSITSATTVSNVSAVNNLTTTVNGVTSAGAPIINSNEISVTGSSLTSTVNGVASTALDLAPIISAATTNTLSLSGNTITSDVNGVASTTDAVGSVSNASAVNTATVTVNGIASTGAPIINSNEISVTGSSLTSTVNGVASTAVDLAPIISAATTNTLSLSGNTLTSDVNGVASTSDAVGSVSNASAVNTATVTVNGIASTGAPIINSNEISLTGSSLTSTVNGVASTAVDLAPVISAATTNTLSLSGNTLTSDVNGVASTSDAVGSVSNTSAVNTATVTVNGIASTGAPIINSNEISVTGSNLTSTVNGVASTAVDLAPVISAATTNDLTAVNGNLISTVNGVVSTPAVPILVTADNGLTSVNGNVQLGGTLITPTVITTDVSNTMALEGLQPGTINDNIIVADPAGILKTITALEYNANNWNILGNAGTNANVNFLGTIDNVNLAFRRNNVAAGRIEINNTSLGVNALNVSSTGAFNAAFGASSLPVNTSGEYNTSLGAYSMFRNTTGGTNTAVGSNTLSTNTTGSFNTAIGFLGMQENATGDHNTALGYAALAGHQSGDNNTAIGSVAGGLGAIGSGNTFIGNNANPTNGVNISNATAIGFNSKVATSNSLVLGGLAADAVNVGIGIDSPTNTLHIKPITGVNPIRVEGLQTGLTTDNVVVADLNGVFKTIAVSSLVPAPTVSNTSTVNNLSTTVNGVTGTGAPIINSNVISLTGANLTSTVNGVASTALDLTPIISATTTNTLTAVNGNLISTVNGTASTPAVPILVTADNGLTATNGNVQLGGTLTNPTTIITDPTNTLSIQGLTFGNPLDDVIVIDQFGLLRSLPSKEFNMNNWSINGNMNIQSSFQFLGTLDDADLVFRRNNIVSGKLEINNTSFGVNSLNGPSPGFNNVAIGTSALAANNGGAHNTVMGFSAMEANTNGSENTAVGFNSLYSNTIGGQNTGFGDWSLYNNLDGNRNTALGYYAGALVTGGDNITLVGAFAESASGLSYATAIGSGAYVATSNSLVLGNIEDIKVGIGTDSPTNAFHVKLPVQQVGLDPIRFEGLQPSSSSSDLTVVIDATGILKTKAVVTGIRSISGNYAFTPDDYTIIARNLTNDITITLPDAALNSGRILIINQFNLVKPDTSPLVVNFNVPVIYSDTEVFPYISTSIFGGPRGQSVKITLQSDGVDWYVVSYTI